MKYILLLALLFLFPKTNFAQWQIIPFPGTGLQSVLSIKFLNDSVGFAAASSDVYSPSVIYKTIDGGNSWSSDSLAANIKDIEFISNDSGYAIGWGAAVYRTINQGNSWQLLNTLSPWVDMRCMKFSNHHNAFAAGTPSLCSSCNDPALLRTTDGWLTFDSIGSPSGEYIPDSNDIGGVFNDMYFADEMHGYTTGGKFILRTDDGGANWYYEDGFSGHYASDGFTIYGAYSIGGIDSNVFAGWMDGGSVHCSGIYRSDDYGTNWDTVGCNPWGGIDTAGNLYDIAFVSQDVGYAVGGPRNLGFGGGILSILLTQDGGNSWVMDTMPVSQLVNTGYAFSVNCPTPQTCYCGGGGVIMKKTNADYGTGIKSVSANHNAQLTIYPNPVTSTVTLQYQTTNAGKSTVTVENCLGQTVTSLQLTNNQKQNINMSNYASGMYFIKCFDGKEQTVIKVVKN